MKLIAHITENNGIKVEQTLAAHCRRTAVYASGSVEGNFKNCCYLAGLLHDFGKAKKEFVEYIEKAYEGQSVKKGSVNHTFAAVIYLLEAYHTETSEKWERLTSELIAYAVGSHHGMFDCLDLDGKNGFLHRLEINREELCYQQAYSYFLNQVADKEEIHTYFLNAIEEVKSFFIEVKKTYNNQSEPVFFQTGMLARLILSSVIYGDRRDTREFMTQKVDTGEQRVIWKEYEEYFEKKIAAFPPDSPLNKVRWMISDQCRKNAEKNCGIYRLNVPTGAGKTLCGLRYAIAHARKYKKKRIIFIIPLLSVLDQNAKVIRKYVPYPERVLEHHSNIIQEKNGAPQAEEADYFEILTENWGAPVIISTLAQFLNILFDDKTSAIGRMQALCDSVIIIDEIQSIPKKTTMMFNMALNFLQQFCRSTIVLSSAIQPCFEELKWPLHFAPEPDMVYLDERQMQVFRRAEIEDHTDPAGMDFEECAAFCGGLMEERTSLLIVCNTKAEARILYELLRQQADIRGWDVFHLSAAMCQEHRVNVMADLERELCLIQREFRAEQINHRMICVSTQLIEAGVDLSFQCVVHVMAGIDNLAQAAGRCDRGMEYGGTGKVYLIRLKNENLRMLPDIAKAQNSTVHVLEFLKRIGCKSYIGAKAVKRFYESLYEEIRQEIRYPVRTDIYQTTLYLADLLANKNEHEVHKENRGYILRQPFRMIGHEFKVFAQETMDVLTPYGEGKALIEQILDMQKRYWEPTAYENILQRVRPYMINIFEWQKKQLTEAGLLFPALEGRLLILDETVYDGQYGLTEIKERPVEDFVI